jgi:hypothetical protein
LPVLLFIALALERHWKASIKVLLEASEHLPDFKCRAKIHEGVRERVIAKC